MALAKCTCTCSTCGSKFEHRAYKYNSREAESYKAWAEEHIDECPDCRQARINKEREEANARAAAEASANALPELAGSPKQISWAVTIRKQMLDELAAVVSKSTRDDIIKDAAAKSLLTMTSASWWIDHRCNGSNRIVMAAMDANPGLAEEVKSRVANA